MTGVRPEQTFAIGLLVGLAIVNALSSSGVTKLDVSILQMLALTAAGWRPPAQRRL